jgi:neurotransmitter:Na+ symporter, NSS family
MKDQPLRERFSSRLGFILSSAGAAVGLGNIQRFPYLVAENGGACFVFIYLLAVLLIALPLMLVEFAIGRHGRSNPVDSIAKITPQGIWKYFGLLGVLTAFFILTYYLVASGWTLSYVLLTAFGKNISLESLNQNGLQTVASTLCFQCVVMLVVMRGVKSGVEKCSKILMPLMIFVLLALIIRVLTLENSLEGLKFYLYPDFSKVTSLTCVYALAQAFFSLCIGEAVLITYGSYAKSEDNLVSSAGYIALFDTAIALLAGLVIFPALFALNMSPSQGAGLLFNVMPAVFLKIAYGQFFGVLFFLLVAFAAFTTCIALLEITVSYTMDVFALSRKRATAIFGSLAFILSIPSALSNGVIKELTELTLPFIPVTGFHNIMDFVWGGLAMVMGGLGLCLFTAQIWGVKNAEKELLKGAPSFKKLAPLWGFLIKFVISPLIILVLLSLFLN